MIYLDFVFFFQYMKLLLTNVPSLTKDYTFNTIKNQISQGNLINVTF